MCRGIVALHHAGSCHPERSEGPQQQANLLSNASKQKNAHKNSDAFSNFTFPFSNSIFRFRLMLFPRSENRQRFFPHQLCHLNLSRRMRKIQFVVDERIVESRFRSIAR
jgi:hypothetical protein